jgi:hypothetical protein
MEGWEYIGVSLPRHGWHGLPGRTGWPMQQAAHGWVLTHYLQHHQLPQSWWRKNKCAFQLCCMQCLPCRCSHDVAMLSEKTSGESWAASCTEGPPPNVRTVGREAGQGASRVAMRSRSWKSSSCCRLMVVTHDSITDAACFCCCSCWSASSLTLCCGKQQ